MTQNQRLYIFGSGAAGHRALEYFLSQASSTILGWIDNDDSKVGSIVSGLPVFSPSQLLDLNHYDKVFIASMWNRDIRRQLIHDLGIPREKCPLIPMNVNKGNQDFRNPDRMILAEILLHHVHLALRNSKLPHYVDHGTLLGIARSGSIIPWDNDVDLAISADHVDASLAALHAELRYFQPHCCPLNSWKPELLFGKIELPIGTRVLPRIIKIVNHDITAVSKHLSCDINIKYLVSGCTYWMVGMRTLTVDDSLISPLSQVSLGIHDYPAPGRVADYLTALYGDWLTPVKDWDHTRYPNLVSD